MNFLTAFPPAHPGESREPVCASFAADMISKTKALFVSKFWKPSDLWRRQNRWIPAFAGMSGVRAPRSCFGGRS